MARVKVRLDHGGMAAMLKSGEVAAAVGAMAESVAANLRKDPAVQRHEVPVDVNHYTTDRAAASVVLAHPAGVPIEAKHGSLTRAAGDAGLEVRSRS